METIGKSDAGFPAASRALTLARTRTHYCLNLITGLLGPKLANNKQSGPPVCCNLADPFSDLWISGILSYSIFSFPELSSYLGRFRDFQTPRRRRCTLRDTTELATSDCANCDMGLSIYMRVVGFILYSTRILFLLLLIPVLLPLLLRQEPLGTIQLALRCSFSAQSLRLKSLEIPRLHMTLNPNGFRGLGFPKTLRPTSPSFAHKSSRDFLGPSRVA